MIEYFQADRGFTVSEVRQFSVTRSLLESSHFTIDSDNADTGSSLSAVPHGEAANDSDTTMAAKRIRRSRWHETTASTDIPGVT